MLTSWKQKVAGLQALTLALYYAYRHPGVRWYARVFLALVVAYAFSPIDLIPDFIPIIGYLDDLILVPLGVTLALKMIPPEVMAECKARAAENFDRAHPQYRFMIVVIVAIWIVVILLIVAAVLRALG